MFLTTLAKILTAGTDMLTDIFDGFTTVAGKVVSFFSTLFTNVAELFWVSGTGLTSFGKLIIIPAGIGAFYLVFRWIKSLIIRF